ncbi:MAG TPA: non-canonical purine NTP pyrophosphatase [Blastocatellia bacterium]|nr:non-canonical purine NTP pyrophosphatase [Blastocatellia bacterium]
MTQSELLIATRNEGKIAELREAFATLPVALRFLNEFKNISEVAEVGETYEENATLKAMSYARQTGITALADDSGLEVAALRGGPGVLSARFGGDHLTDTERTRTLLSSLDQSGSTSRIARFVCCMVVYGWPSSQQAELSTAKVLAVTQGVCEGAIAHDPTGTDGFGFDPIFIPTGYAVSFAALDQAIKRRISHRARAAEKMRQQLDLFLRPNLTAGRSAS